MRADFTSRESMSHDPMPDDSASADGALTIDILVGTECWSAEPDAEAIVRQAVAMAAEHTDTANAEVAIMLLDDDGIRTLNRDWRGFDKPTNVLSFAGPATSMHNAPQMLGDIAIAFETTQREAIAETKSFHNHLSHLAIHGFLHLIGYDHETDEDAELMEQLERRILAQLNIPDPY
jgi:probable rRNA maturation factor